MAVDGRAALLALLNMRSPSNMTPTGNTYADTARVDAGDADMAPSDAELTAMQNTEGLGTFSTPEREVRTSSSPWSLGGGGSAVRGTSVIGGNSTSLSRDAMKDTAMQALRQRLGLIGAQSAADTQKAVAPEMVKGQFGLKEAEMKLKAATADKDATRMEADARQQRGFDAADSRQQAGFTHADTAREDAQSFKGGQVNSQAMAAIMREQEALGKDVAKGNPGALGRMFGSTNARQGEVDNFKNNLAYAMKIAQEHPNASAEEAFTAMGLTPDPAELAQIQSFLIRLRGH